MRVSGLLENVPVTLSESELFTGDKSKGQSFTRNVLSSLIESVVYIIIAIYHSLFITLLLGSKAETKLVKQPCYIQTKMDRFYRKITFYGHFSVIL